MSDFVKKIESFSRLKVIVIGDLMVDSYIRGEVERISPEAPVPVVSGLKREMRLGGAANVALNIQLLGAQPLLFGIVGDDEKGRVFVRMVDQNNMDSSGVLVDKSRPTTVKTRIISNNQHLLRVDDESSNPVNTEIKDKMVEGIKQYIDNNEINGVLFEDYDKGVLSEDLISRVVNYCNKRSIPVFVDPKKRNYHAYQGVSLFKPNFKEFTEGMKEDVKKNDFENLFELSKKFINDRNIDMMLLTLAEQGIFICNREAFNHVHALEKLDVADVSGAGDTVISVAALCYITGMERKDIAWVSNLAGGLVCERSGVVPIEKGLLMKEIEKRIK
jgi:rfaE bifunctional protein kinase chain/domain